MELRSRPRDQIRRSGARRSRTCQDVAFTSDGARRKRRADGPTDPCHAVPRMDALLAVRIAASPTLERRRCREYGRPIPVVRQWVDLRSARGPAVSGTTGAGAVGPGPRPGLSGGRALALAGARRQPASRAARVPRRLAAPVPTGGVGRPRPRGSVHPLRGIRAVAAARPVRGLDVAAAVVSGTPRRSRRTDWPGCSRSTTCASMPRRPPTHW